MANEVNINMKCVKVFFFTLLYVELFKRTFFSVKILPSHYPDYLIHPVDGCLAFEGIERMHLRARMLGQNWYSHRLCVSVALFQNSVKKRRWTEGGGVRGALSGEGQRVKPMGILGDGALPKRW